MPHLNQFDELPVLIANREAIALVIRREQISRLHHHARVDKVGQDSIQTAPIPIIGHAASVVTLAAQIEHGLVRDIGVLVDVHL